MKSNIFEKHFIFIINKMEHGAIGKVGHHVQLLVVMELIEDSDYVINNMEEEIVLDLIPMCKYALLLSVLQVRIILIIEG
jgi:hypothetical protein